MAMTEEQETLAVMGGWIIDTPAKTEENTGEVAFAVSLHEVNEYRISKAKSKWILDDSYSDNPTIYPFTPEGLISGLKTISTDQDAYKIWTEVSYEMDAYFSTTSLTLAPNGAEDIVPTEENTITTFRDFPRAFSKAKETMDIRVELSNTSIITSDEIEYADDARAFPSFKNKVRTVKRAADTIKGWGPKKKKDFIDNVCAESSSEGWSCRIMVAPTL